MFRFSGICNPVIVAYCYEKTRGVDHLQNFYSNLKSVKLSLNTSKLQQETTRNARNFKGLRLIRRINNTNFLKTQTGIYMPEVLLTASSIKAMKRNDTWTIENALKSERELSKALSVQISTDLKQASFGLPT